MRPSVAKLGSVAMSEKEVPGSHSNNSINGCEANEPSATNGGSDLTSKTLTGVDSGCTISNKKPFGFAQLAGRISSLTSTLILSAVIVIAGIMFGRQVLLWWKDTPPDKKIASPTIGTSGNLGDPLLASHIQFASQPWTLTRQTIPGSYQTALSQLRVLCTKLVSKSQIPQAEAGKGERQLLRLLVRSQSVAQKQGQWQIYELSGGIPMVAGVRQVPKRPNKPPPKPTNGDLASTKAVAEDDIPSDNKGGTHLVVPTSRVVTWGLAFPEGKSQWLLLAFHCEEGEQSTRSVSTNSATLLLPPGSQKILSIQTEDGGGIVAFRGKVPIEQWVRFYNQRFHQEGRLLIQPWQHSDKSWYARFGSSANRQSESVIVQLSSDEHGTRNGLLMTIPESKPNAR